MNSKPPAEEQRMTEYLPQTRCTPELKQALREIAARSVSKSLSDHIRFAVELYVEMKQAQAPQTNNHTS